MSISEKIRLLLRRRKMTITELAARLHLSRQSVTKKLKDNHFTVAELQNIAAVLGCEIEILFVDRGERL